MTSRYHTDETTEWDAPDSGSLLELDGLRAELADRKQGCSCRWAPKPGLMPNPECPAHGVETTDLLTLGRTARDAALQVLTTGQVPR